MIAASPVVLKSDLMKWVWSAPAPTRNAFTVFRRRFALPALPNSAILQICADARYRLRVNGIILAHGPARSAPSHPECDELDLTPWLHAGANELLVEVWSPETNTFQTMPEARAGFTSSGIIHCGRERISLATPGDWECHVSHAWASDAPAYSFAQGPVEICDLRILSAKVRWQKPVIISGPWGRTQRRSTPRPDERPRQIVDVVLAGPLVNDEQRLSARVYAPGHGRGSIQTRFPYELRIQSPCAQDVTLGLFWGPHRLNGVELAMTTVAHLGNRQETTAHFTKGWNVLSGEPELLQEVWSIQIGLPRKARLIAGRFRVGVARPVHDLGSGDPGWREIDHANADQLPSRACAWDRPTATCVPGALPQELSVVGDQVVLLDAGYEFLGRITCDITASAGTLIDVVVDERRRADGLIGLYATNPFTDAADRYVHPGGRVTISGFHPRGGRLIQLILRPPALKSGMKIIDRMTVHAVAVRSSTTPFIRDGAFTCSDPVFDWTWHAGARTLAACSSDAFLDCPWREQGTYLGDAVIEACALRALSSDHRLITHTTNLFADGQLPNGQMPACSPSWHRLPHEDFSLRWVQLVYEEWAHTGDLKTVRSRLPAIERILDSSAWCADRDGLWTAEGLHLFIDWGVHREGRSGPANAMLNLLRVRALLQAAELLTACGRDATGLRHEADGVSAAIRKRLWLAGEGRYRSNTNESDDDALHANALALLTPACVGREKSLIRHLEAGLARNLERGLAGAHAGHLELAFLHDVLEALYHHGRTATAESVMRSHWGLMRNHNAWTLWETLCDGAKGNGSLCHAWAATPLHWFHQRILGVRQMHAGDPDTLVIAPESLLPWASGTVPHRRGAIEVSWQQSGGVLQVQTKIPKGIEFTVQPGPTFSRHRLVVSTT